MKQRPSQFLLALCLLGISWLLLSAQAPKTETVTYEAVRPTSRCWYFLVEGEFKPDPVKLELSKLSTASSDCKIAMTPESSAKLKASHFVAVEAPVGCDPKLIAAALKKGSRNATQLNILAAQSNDLLDMYAALDSKKLSALDRMLDLSDDIRWYRNNYSERQFFFTGTKLNHKTISERFGKSLAADARNNPKISTELGTLPVGRIQWQLQAPMDPAAVERAQQALAALPGVRTAKIDPQSAILRMEVVVDGVPSSGGIRPSPKLVRQAKAEGVDEKNLRLLARMRFDTWPIFEVLDKEQLTLAEAAPKK